MINEYWQHYQTIINARFNLIKAKYSHPGNKGTCGENVVKDFLNEYMSNSVLVGHGEAIDSFENRSGQLDIVIAEKDSQPFIYDSSAPNIFIIEAVVSAGEVKFNIDNMEELVKKCKRFKQLRPKSLNGDIRLTNQHDAKRFYDKRSFFVFS